MLEYSRVDTCVFEVGVHFDWTGPFLPTRKLVATDRSRSSFALD
jgi:hypothetical protein